MGHCCRLLQKKKPPRKKKESISYHSTIIEFEKSRFEFLNVNVHQESLIYVTKISINMRIINSDRVNVNQLTVIEIT